MVHLEQINNSLSSIYESYKSNDDIEVHTIIIYEWDRTEFINHELLFNDQIGGPSSKRLLKKFKIEYKSLPIGDILYTVLAPDEETFLMKMNNLKDGYLYLISNDYLYLHSALTHVVFSGRKEFNDLSSGYDIEYGKIIGGQYVDLFLEELEAFYHEIHSTEMV